MYISNINKYFRKKPMKLWHHYSVPFSLKGQLTRCAIQYVVSLDRLESGEHLLMFYLNCNSPDSLQRAWHITHCCSNIRRTLRTWAELLLVFCFVLKSQSWVGVVDWMGQVMRWCVRKPSSLVANETWIYRTLTRKKKAELQVWPFSQSTGIS